MNSNEQPMNERQAFEELLGDDRFDDSVCDQHQSDLRFKVLQAFDQPDREATIAELHVRSSGERRRASWSQSLGYASILAVCLIGLVALWIYGGNESADTQIVDHAPVPDVTEDSRLLASLAEVNAFRDEVSREAFFDAIAICQLDHEGRTSFDSNQP